MTQGVAVRILRTEANLMDHRDSRGATLIWCKEARAEHAGLLVRAHTHQLKFVADARNQTLLPPLITWRDVSRKETRGTDFD